MNRLLVQLGQRHSLVYWRFQVRLLSLSPVDRLLKGLQVLLLLMKGLNLLVHTIRCMFELSRLRGRHVHIEHSHHFLFDVLMGAGFRCLRLLLRCCIPVHYL